MTWCRLAQPRGDEPVKAVLHQAQIKVLPRLDVFPMLCKSENILFGLSKLLPQHDGCGFKK